MKVIDEKTWRDVNERDHTLATDEWYVNFANKLLPLAKQSTISTYDNHMPVDVAIFLSLYLQDITSKSGGWKWFSDLYTKLYGSNLPFYTVSDDYLASKINREDIAFILWTLKSHCAIWGDDKYTLFSPFDEGLLALSQRIYERMDACFEEAPVTEEPSNFSWVMGLDLLEMPIIPLLETTPETNLHTDVNRCLAYSNGRPLLYFATYKDLKTFFIEVLKWENKPSALLPELIKKKEFVIYANTKGILIAHSVAAYFCDEHNPMYNAQLAVKEGYKIFCRPGVCPFDLIKYGMTKGLLPDLKLPFKQGKEVLQNNWDFIARYYLCEYYEGE